MEARMRRGERKRRRGYIEWEGKSRGLGGGELERKSTRLMDTHVEDKGARGPEHLLTLRSS